MTTFVAVYDDQGKYVGGCNATCYDAMPPTNLVDTRSRRICGCICCGANHAVGQDKAFRNYARQIGLRPKDLEDFARHRGLDPAKLVAVDRLRVAPHKAKAYALARLREYKPKPGDLFAYGLVAHRKATEDA